MFFVTFDDVIYVYYDICLSSVYLKTLSDVLDKDIEMVCIWYINIYILFVIWNNYNY